MSGHSPGPWYWHNNAAGYDELRTAGEGNPVIGQWGEWPPLSESDARLIVAAPAMLEMLRQLSSESFNGENAVLDSGCAYCGYFYPGVAGPRSHGPGCKLYALLAEIDDSKESR